MLNRVPVVMALASFLAAGTAAASPGGSYEPKIGDSATAWVRTAIPGKGAEVRKVMKGHFEPALKSDEIVGDAYLLVDEKENEFLSFRFNAPVHGNKSPHLSAIEKKLKGLVQGPAKISTYKLVLAVNDDFVAKDGDKVVVDDWQVKKGKLEQAEAIYRDQLVPAAKADSFKRAYLLLEDAVNNVLIGVTIHKGDVLSGPKVAEKRKLLDPLMEKPARQVTYTLYHFSDE